ncbi:hypothetical protein NOK12_30120 [Nocardioides sp. OK12]|uniref:hypothetical protein n=1 Tax=Nocardioides TaxID=1839 RepID=UPI0021C30BD5|nr:hypothetical protein [Nocardioides sp. OK12]GHJ60494.1 hypothetical protein NOK12_30120 [Nocardioides sp. OK12]
MSALLSGGISAVVTTVATTVVGGTIAAVTVVGLVNANTGTQGESPANVNQPVVQYGTNG